MLQPWRRHRTRFGRCRALNCSVCSSDQLSLTGVGHLATRSLEEVGQAMGTRLGSRRSGGWKWRSGGTEEREGDRARGELEDGGCGYQGEVDYSQGYGSARRELISR